MQRTEEIRVRDPFVVAHCGKYYLYSSTVNKAYPECFPEGTLNLVVYESTDLENWSEPRVAFRYKLGESEAIVADLWAAEVHLYKGKFYAFMSFRAANGYRGTFSAVSDKPEGPFELTSEVPLTPVEMSCIDGTLYLEDGVPYIVFSRDWPFNYVESKGAYVGELWARKLSDDLSAGEGEAFLLFTSDEAPISKATPHRLKWEGKESLRFGSDAPFMLRLADGTLMMTWSPYLHDNYVVLSAVSDNGSIKGKWIHSTEPVYSDNGGHAMFFRDFDGTRKMCLHAPEAVGLERMRCFEIKENGRTIEIEKRI